MEKYTVLYNWGRFGVYGFICDAEDIDHAEEQCQNAYPECNIFWVHKGNSIIDAKNEWIGEQTWLHKMHNKQA